MAALAQQESESISANVRLGIQFRNQQGIVQVNHKRFLGYTKDKDGKLVIVPEEADVVRRICSEFLGGATLCQIKKGLERDGIVNGAGNKVWWDTNIRQILTNEKYIGDALLQKTYTVDILEKKRCKNDGVLPKYYVEGCHEAIIERDVFLKVQSEMQRRANLTTAGKKRLYGGKYALSGIVFCGYCGDIYRRIKWNNRGKKSTVWRCVSRVLKKSSGIDCPARTVREEELQRAVVTAINDVWSRRENVLPVLKTNIQSVIAGDNDELLAEVDSAIRKKQTELLQVGLDDRMVEQIGDEIMLLRDRRQEIMEDAALQQEEQERLTDMMAFLDEQIREITDYSDLLVRRLIDKITIYDEKMTVEFKSGLEVEVDA